MKQILLATLLLLALASCHKATVPATNRLNVVTTIFPAYDFVRQVAGDEADVTLLLPLGSESHSFEPTPQDIIRLRQCDVFIYVGGSSDAWVDKILGSMDTSNMKIISLIDLVEPISEVHHEGTDSHEDEYDEHVWTSPKNALRMVAHIKEVLCSVDPENAQTYEQNAATYGAKLENLDRSFQEVVDKAARKTLVFGGRFPFLYFARDYGLTCYSAFPGCATEESASAATLKRLIDTVRAEKLPVVLHLEFSNQKLESAISEETGAQVRLFHSCHNISREDFRNGVGYLELMRGNLDVLKEALL